MTDKAEPAVRSPKRAEIWAKRALSRTRGLALPNALALQARIMISGDSIMRGGSSVQDNTADGPRAVLWSALREVRGNIVFLGDQSGGLFDNRAALPASNPPGDSIFGDWRCAATGGNNLAQIDAEATLVEAAQGPADVATLLGGENDIQQGIAAGHTNAVIEAAVLAGIANYCNNRPRSTKIIVSTLTTHGVGLASYVQSNVIQQAVNAALPALIPSLGLGNVSLVDAGGQVTQSELLPDGQHPALSGLAGIGRRFADKILELIGIGGLPTRTAPVERLPAPRLLLAAANAAQVPDPSLIPLPGESFSMGKVLYPTDLSQAYQRQVFWMGPDLAPSGFPDGSGAWLLAGPAFAGAPNGAANLQFYLGGVAQFTPNDSLRLNTIHYIAFSYDHTQGACRIWCLRPGPDGRLVTTLVSEVLGVPTFTMPAGTRVSWGADNALGSGETVPGLTGDGWIARNVVVTADQMEEWYRSGEIPTPSAYYAMSEGAGVAIHPAPGETGLQGIGVCTNSWSAAGAIFEPTHRYADSQPQAKPQAGIFVLTTTGGATALLASQVASETHVAAGNASVLEVLGVLASDATITWPAVPGQTLVVDNATSGAHAVTINGIAVTQGTTGTFYFNAAGAIVRSVVDT